MLLPSFLKNIKLSVFSFIMIPFMLEILSKNGASKLRRHGRRGNAQGSQEIGEHHQRASQLAKEPRNNVEKGSPFLIPK